ncbi:cell shape-determining protein [Robertkochia marina]|uniref:Cell shape-determining protein n=1 Tax=Robertkochia marina TaxID=1227945 RepID=A0A4S3M3H2_9FLAO|nr:sodium:proton antiporter [Robertkochia marina]THD69295.1 cell shape-determining protein [Robertkochia marina]TRZ47447.1 cell shape-determining protein [Robertkochia marina]
MLELAGIIILGIIAQWVAWRFKIPAILPLILIGLAVGPIATLYTHDGTKLIEPVWHPEYNKGLFPGESLFHFVSLAIAVILFEGGLTLKRNEVLNVGPVIIKLITVGTLVTFLLAGVVSHFLFDLSWPISFLFASLIIVTGPTVITPILRNIPLKKDLSAVLKWEGILIDPIGAVAAVLVFEFIRVGQGEEYTRQALIEFGKTVVVGLSEGFFFAYALYFVIKKKMVPHYLMNVFTLSVVLGVFVLSEQFAHESGLLSVVVMGMVLGNIDLPNIKELLYFKESLSVLLISILFILLAANIDMNDLYLVYNWETLLLFASVVFIIRPLGVFLSTLGSGLKFNERLFISWVGPRGIVAAGIASLFGTRLALEGEPGAEYITPLVFVIVLGTVLLNAATARIFAKISGVFLKESTGILIVGSSKVSRLIGKYLQKNDRHVVLIDSNKENIEKAKAMDLDAEEANIFSDELTDNIEFNDIGYLMALTASEEVNKHAIERFREQLGENGAFRLITSEEMMDPSEANDELLFSKKDDYINLSEVARDYPKINEIDLNSREEYLEYMHRLNNLKDSIPIFVKDLSGEIHIIASFTDMKEIEPGYKLVYLGKPVKLIKEEIQNDVENESEDKA